MLVVYPVSGNSMEPNVHDMDKVLLYRTQDVKYDDIVVFDSEYYQECLIKRVIGLPGDRIDIRYDEENEVYHIFRNDEKLNEDYILRPMTQRYYEQSIVVPEGEFFFLGDNRNFSQDSHTEGITEGLDQIKGKVILRYNGFDINFIAIGV